MAEAPIAEGITKRKGPVHSSVAQGLPSMQKTSIFISSIMGEDDVRKSDHSSSVIYSNAKGLHIWGSLFQK